ncbi:MAG: antibiotic biosynthesis monooxygenase [Clostridiales bacterium]|nr:antibiotic biosynthesis monooxygenase [Clostridiales bacterium]
MVAVVVKENLKDGQKAAFVEYMREMIALTKQEDGCIAYDLYESVDGAGEVVMVELWETKEALDRHMETDHFKKFLPGGEVYKNGPPEIKVFEKL